MPRLQVQWHMLEGAWGRDGVLEVHICHHLHENPQHVGQKGGTSACARNLPRVQTRNTQVVRLIAEGEKRKASHQKMQQAETSGLHFAVCVAQELDDAGDVEVVNPTEYGLAKAA